MNIRRALPLSSWVVFNSSALTSSVSSILVPPQTLFLTQSTILGQFSFRKSLSDRRSIQHGSSRTFETKVRDDPCWIDSTTIRRRSLNTRATGAERRNHGHNTQQSKHSTSRRSFLRKGLAVGGAGAIGAGLLANGLSLPAFAEESSSSLTKGDVAILRLPAAVEIIESDLWQQYNELGGIQDSEVQGGSGSAPYVAGLLVLDGDMFQYIRDNTEDEFSHMNFLNAYLASKGVDPVNLARFRTVPSSQATGYRLLAHRTAHQAHAAYCGHQ